MFELQLSVTYNQTFVQILAKTSPKQSSNPLQDPPTTCLDATFCPPKFTMN